MPNLDTLPPIWFQDCVTEKYFNIQPFNLIPVVLNGANMSSIAPPHSYINAEDFNSTEALSIYWQLLPKTLYLVLPSGGEITTR